MIKKLFLGALALLALPAMVAYAATPMFMVSGTGNGNATVSVSGGEINSPVVLYYNSSNLGTTQAYTLGTTNASGTFSGSFNTDMIGINSATPVYVQVGGYQSNSVQWPYMAGMNGNGSANGGITFSQSSPYISVGQNGTITLSGGNGNYYISSNSNASGITPSISGNTLTLYGAATGSGSITVCSTGGGCGTIYPTIQSGTASPSVSSSNISFGAGGQGSLTLSGGAGPYTVSVPSGSGISTTLVGNTLYINGSTTGMATVNVCSLNGTTSNGGCTPVTVNVQAAGSTSGTGTNTSTNNNGWNMGGMSFSLPLSVGQALALNLSGGNGSYYLQSPMSSPVLASLNGNQLMLNGSAIGNGTVSICQTGTSSCLPISFSVGPASSTSLNGTGGGYFFDTDLSIGMTGQDVTELQQRLMEAGYLTVSPTGYFGHLTASAVMKYQAAHGVATTGYVGPLTRAELNK